MNKRYLLILLIVAQLAVPSWLIASTENILKNGVAFKFKTAPVDPYDIFRGRYVALSSDQRTVDLKQGEKYYNGQDVYLILENDQEGFAKVVRAQYNKPLMGDYIKGTARYQYENQLQFDIKISRYYMSEKKAPKAEGLYRKISRQGVQDAYILVRVYNGKPLIEDLYIKDKPIGSYF